MKITHLLFLFTSSLGVAIAGPITFQALPTSGVLTASLGSTVGWGYTIDNQTADFLVPFGLANSGVVNGALVDIFDYPVVDPGQTISQGYAFNFPGGFGNSLGLYEYSVPANAPVGFIESGMFTLSYELFTANPDLNSSAQSVGSLVDVSSPFQVTVEASAVPEPASMALVALGLALLTRSRVRPTTARSESLLYSASTRPEAY